eukprot:3940538-Rhodomonas_salina.2
MSVTANVSLFLRPTTQRDEEDDGKRENAGAPLLRKVVVSCACSLCWGHFVRRDLLYRKFRSSRYRSCAAVAVVQRAKQVPTRFSLCPGYAMSAADITCDGLRRCGSLLRIRGGMNFIDAGDEDNDFSLGEEGIEAGDVEHAEPSSPGEQAGVGSISKCERARADATWLGRRRIFRIFVSSSLHARVRAPHGTRIMHADLQYDGHHDALGPKQDRNT